MHTTIYTTSQCFPYKRIRRTNNTDERTLKRTQRKRERIYEFNVTNKQQKTIMQWWGGVEQKSNLKSKRQVLGGNSPGDNVGVVTAVVDMYEWKCL